MTPLHDNPRKPSVRPSVSDKAKAVPSGESATEPQALITRRRFLYGAIGVGAVAAIGIGGAALSSASSEGNSDISYLDAPKRALSTLNDFTALDDYGQSIQLIGQYDLPYGSLIWANDESVAACLLPTETGSPLTQVGLLFLGSGSYDTVLEKAVGAGEGFEIYDVRANSSGLIWTEASILRGTWRIYAAPITSGTAGAASLLEEGDDAYDTPTLAVVGARAFWQVNPKPVENGDMPAARLMSASFSGQNITTVFESRRRMSCPPYASSDSITIAPRVDSPSTYYELTNINASTGEVTDTLTLPHAITPVEAGYGKTGFMFSFPDIYDYDGAVANLGTYAPREKPASGNYNDAQWFDFARTPTAAPAWCGNLLIVKSTYSVCGVDLDAGTYFAIDVDDGADTYGEYLASTGEESTFVTYTNIDHTPVGAAAIHACRVKVWTTV